MEEESFWSHIFPLPLIVHFIYELTEIDSSPNKYGTLWFFELYSRYLMMNSCPHASQPMILFDAVWFCCYSISDVCCKFRSQKDVLSKYCFYLGPFYLSVYASLSVPNNIGWRICGFDEGFTWARSKENWGHLNASIRLFSCCTHSVWLPTTKGLCPNNQQSCPSFQ